MYCTYCMILLFLNYLLYFICLCDCVTITVTVSSNMTNVWQYDYDINLTLTLDPRIKKRKRKRKLNKKARVQALYIWQFYTINITMVIAKLIVFVPILVSTSIFILWQIVHDIYIIYNHEARKTSKRINKLLEQRFL